MLCTSTTPRSRIHRNTNSNLAVVLLAPLLWLGWLCAAPPPPLLGVLRPIPFGVGVISEPFFFLAFFSERMLTVQDVAGALGGAAGTLAAHQRHACALQARRPLHCQQGGGPRWHALAPRRPARRGRQEHSRSLRMLAAAAGRGLHRLLPHPLARQVTLHVHKC